LAGAAPLFAALGDPTRLTLLQRLSRDGPASISTLADDFRTTRQGVTKHLHVLAAARIIDGERRGREHVWAINPRRLADGQRHLPAMSFQVLAQFLVHGEEGFLAGGFVASLLHACRI